MSLPNQLYPTLPNANHGTPGMMYTFDSAILITGHGQTVTGGWRPVVPTDFATNISLTGGTFNAAVDDVAVTGGSIAISNIPTVAIQNGALVSITGIVQVTDSTFNTVSNSTVSGSNSAITTGQLFAANAVRNTAYIQVVGSGTPLFVLYGATAASTTNFNVLLKSDSAFEAGNGGTLIEDAYTGAMTVSGGIGCFFIAWQA